MKGKRSMKSTSLATPNTKVQKIGVSFDYFKYFSVRRKRFNLVRQTEKKNVRCSLENNTQKKWLQPLRRRYSNPENVTNDIKNTNSENEISDATVPVIIILYNHLQILFGTAREYAIVHKCLCNSIKTGSYKITDDQVLENRKRLSFVLDEIAHISQRIEKLNTEVSGGCGDGVFTMQNLQKNIRLHASHVIQEISLRINEDTQRLLTETTYSPTTKYESMLCSSLMCMKLF